MTEDSRLERFHIWSELEQRLSELQSVSGEWLDRERVCKLLKKPVPQGKWSEKEMATTLAVVNVRLKGTLPFATIADKGNAWLTKNLGAEETQEMLTWAAGL
jgi:hypothetical protein